MLAALTKPLEEITRTDLDELSARGWPESENVEYKRELHREGNQADPWYSGKDISDASKKKIFKELVAFANTSGGRLFVGVEETSDRPPRASAVHPVPRCCELAERLEQSIVNSIDPPLTFYRVVGIPTNGNGDGVLAAEVSASYNGPHRSSDLRCYVRKGTNSVPVGMREIHDMVMRLSRRQDEIRQRLAERRELFHEWIPRRLIVQNLQVAFRVTAIPVGAPLYQDRIFGNRLISQPLKNIVGKWVSSPSNAHTQRFEIPMIVGSERPILGGTRWADSWDQRSIQQVILRDGIVDVWFKCPWYNRSGHPDSVLFFDWIIAASANVLVRLDSFREAAQAPMCEYGLEVEILSTNGAADCAVQLVIGPIARLLGSAFETPAMLGRYSVGDRDRVMNLIARDLQEACGVANDQETLEIDWSA